MTAERFGSVSTADLELAYWTMPIIDEWDEELNDLIAVELTRRHVSIQSSILLGGGEK